MSHPRSGSSLLRRLMNEDSRIAIPPEAAFAVWVRKQHSLLLSRLETEPPNEETYRQLAECFVKTRKFEFWGLSAEDLYTEFATVGPTSYKQVVAVTYELFAKRAGRPNASLGDKNNSYFFDCSAALSVLGPDHVVVLLRDPAEVWASYESLRVRQRTSDSSYYPPLPANVAAFCDEWQDGYTEVLDEAQRSARQFVLIEYGALLESPRSLISAICDQVSYPSRRSDSGEIERSAPLFEPAEFADWKANVSLAPSRRNQQSSLESLPPLVRRQIDASCADVVDRYRLVARELREGVTGR
ncbi:MAG: sulfotransferase [Actinobacteria bacterium]|nr:sulfotransferase [Actinomycetota bacterium]